MLRRQWIPIGLYKRRRQRAHHHHRDPHRFHRHPVLKCTRPIRWWPHSRIIAAVASTYHNWPRQVRNQLASSNVISAFAYRVNVCVSVCELNRHWMKHVRASRMPHLYNCAKHFRMTASCDEIVKLSRCYRWKWRKLSGTSAPKADLLNAQTNRLPSTRPSHFIILTRSYASALNFECYAKHFK